jgi:hypothetical protein
MGYALVKQNTFADAGSTDKIFWQKDDGSAGGVQTAWTRTAGGADFVARLAMSSPSALPWNDPNHYYPGAGWLNLLWFAFVGASHEIPDGHEDLRNGKIEFRLKLSSFYLPPTCRLVLGIQGVNADVAYNYAQIAEPICAQLGFGGGSWGTRNKVHGIKTMSAFRDVVVHFSTDDRDWICMGSNPNRTGVNPDAGGTYYGALPTVADALADVNADIFIWALHDQNWVSPSTPPAQRPFGTIDMDRYALYEAD